MPLAANLRFQDYQFQQATPAGTWRWTTRMDLTGLSPAFSVRDILSPYGILRDSIPIPGLVIQAMSDSISELQNTFKPNFLVSPLTLTFTQDEGRGFTDFQSVVVSNNGMFGSLLDAVITTDAPYVVARPSRIGNLAPSEEGTVEVAADTTSLLAVNSPYNQTITFQDSSATNSPVSVAVVVNVRPKATIELTPTGGLTFYVTKPLTGPFPAIPVQTFTLQNTGASASLLSYVVQKLIGNSPWLVSYSPISGQLAGGASQTITVGVAPPAACSVGTYKETLRISGYSTNAHQDIDITLVIS